MNQWSMKPKISDLITRIATQNLASPFSSSISLFSLLPADPTPSIQFKTAPFTLSLWTVDPTPIENPISLSLSLWLPFPTASPLCSPSSSPARSPTPVASPLRRVAKTWRKSSSFLVLAYSLTPHAPSVPLACRRSSNARLYLPFPSSRMVLGSCLHFL